MFAFGVCVSAQERFQQLARPGIERCAEPDTVIFTRQGQRSICAAYNDILASAQQPGLEGVVMLHDDTEIRSPRLLSQLRETFSDPEIAVAGPIGAAGVRSLSWWEWDAQGHVTDKWGIRDHSEGTRDVDALDGLFLALSPWAVRTLRFDAVNFPHFNGYDIDYCLQAKAHGKRVITLDLDLNHHTRGIYWNAHAFQQADLRLRRKWGFDVPLRLRLSVFVHHGSRSRWRRSCGRRSTGSQLAR